MELIKSEYTGNLQELPETQNIEAVCFARSFLDPNNWVLHQKILPTSLKYGDSLS